MQTYFHPETENYKYWSVTEIQELEQLTSSGKHSFSQISKQMKRSVSSCMSMASKLGLSNNYVKKVYTVDEDFWAIPNLINCYWAGFSAADASIEKKTENNIVYRLEISNEDIEHLKNLHTTCKYTGPIVQSPTRPHVRFAISSKKWGQDLEQIFNIGPKKTNRLSPPKNLTDEQYFAWLIGYTDGDGCIYLSNNNLGIKYVSSSEHIIIWIKQFIETSFTEKLKNKVSNVRKDTKWNAWYYTICGIKAAIIIDYLRQFPVPKLFRKWENPQILEKINQYKNEFPQLFRKTDLKNV